MKGIIFDFNGTLFGDSHMHYDAWREFSKKLRGTAFSDEEMLQHMFGHTNKDIIKYCIGREPDEEMVERLANEKESLYRQRCLNDRENLRLTDGAEEFLDFLKENNIPMAIATMSEWQNVKFYLKEFNLTKWFDIDKIVYSNGKIPGKPAADIYEIAAKKIKLAPKDCVVIEDAIPGIESAKSAGIGKIIAIASFESVDLYKNIDGIYQIIKNFNEIDKNIFDNIRNKTPLR